ncbi:MAG: aspartate aminotransferase family protein [Candidatus Omnitrophica bacterium]|nr:aspartate aminotransferase family protein [Candidatus Omnitrophota bacterium]MDD5352664.1 aspartate aminotransferase family protein [Candidatus Omnitrophota bacterium]MDD5550263.1 aspartate aminotransferase family protein [Candidatus Omnitrophota bacterium]
MTINNRRYKQSHILWEKANSLLLNGVSTFSKSPLYITLGACPIFAERAKGAYFWDCDGNRYIDYPLALGPIILGYAYDEVDSAVKRQMSRGFLYSLSNRLELELSEILCDIIPSAEKVKILKTGSEAMSAAVRVARAYTGREIVAVCGYHGWHDWTITRTVRDAGIPAALKKLIFEFKYNDLNSLERIFSQNKGKVAAVILEPVGMYAPKDNFLSKIAKLARKNQALLIFDEVITGFRLSLGGAQSYFSVMPDLSVFGKAMANGYPISVLVGKKEIMNAVENKVFISSTFGGDLLSITASIKTIEILRKRKVNDYILALGQRLKNGLNEAIARYKIDAKCEGLPHKTFLVFKDMRGVSGKMIETLFRQECLLNGVFLGYGHFVSFSHTKKDVDYTIGIASQVFSIIRQALDRGDLPSLLQGKLAVDVFKRY